jgi:peptide/nickel transport system substrate-binding protein
LGENNGVVRIRVSLILLLLAVASCTKQPQPPDHLGFAVPYDPYDLDPQAWDTLSSMAISSHFYEGLVAVDANLRIQPALAVRWENPDQSTWVLHLRPHVKFHSGKNFTSKDVLYSFERVMKDQTLETSVYARNIAEIRTLGDFTVQIKTVRATSLFLEKIRLINIVPQGSAGSDLQNQEDGTGPYRLQGWHVGEVVRMVRNENYWGPKPYLRRVEFRLRQTPDLALQELRSGRCGFIQCNSKKLSYEAEGSRRFQVLRGDSLFVMDIGFNLSANQNPPGPFANKLVRQAIHLALDRQKLVSQLSVLGTPATQPIPVFVFGYNPEIPPVEPDPKRVADLLKESGWKPEKPPVMHVRDVYRETGEIVRDQLAAAGIALDVQFLPDDPFFALQSQGQVSCFISRYGCTTGDASDMLDSMFYSGDRTALYSGVDASRYVHPPVTGAAEPEPGPSLLKHRREGLQKVMSLLMEDLLLVPLYVQQDAFALDKSYTWQPRYDSLVLADEVSPAH